MPIPGTWCRSNSLRWPPPNHCPRSGRQKRRRRQAPPLNRGQRKPVQQKPGLRLQVPAMQRDPGPAGTMLLPVRPVLRRLESSSTPSPGAPGEQIPPPPAPGASQLSRNPLPRNPRPSRNPPPRLPRQPLDRWRTRPPRDSSPAQASTLTTTARQS